MALNPQSMSSFWEENKSTDFLTESAMAMAKMEEILARTVDPNVPPPTKTEEEHKMSPGDLAMGTNQNGGES